ncbi:MAG: hypothetical protein GY730_03910 [bacterium]|nr:hypothetical protein [bacterium]
MKPLLVFVSILTFCFGILFIPPISKIYTQIVHTSPLDLTAETYDIFIGGSILLIATSVLLWNYRQSKNIELLKALCLFNIIIWSGYSIIHFRIVFFRQSRWLHIFGCDFHIIFLILDIILLLLFIKQAHYLKKKKG